MAQGRLAIGGGACCGRESGELKISALTHARNKFCNVRKINYALGVRARLSPIPFLVKVKVIYEGKNGFAGMILVVSRS